MLVFPVIEVVVLSVQLLLKILVRDLFYELEPFFFLPVLCYDPVEVFSHLFLKHGPVGLLMHGVISWHGTRALVVR